MSSTEVAEVQAPVTDVAAESSAAGDKESVLDAVKASLNPTEESPASTETGKETVKAESAEEADEDEGEPDDGLTPEEKTVLSKRSQDRFRSLVSARKASDAKVSELTPKAESFDRIVAYNRQHGISNTEFNNALELIRIGKTEPNRAFDLVAGILQQLAQRTGRALSPELQERIRLGHISEQDARKLSQAEASEKFTRERTEAERTAAEQASRARAWGEQVNSASSAVDAWAKAEAGTDPDWSKKIPHIARALELELTRLGPDGYPKTKEEAVELAKKVKKQVEKDLKPFRSKPKEIAHVAGGGSSSRSDAEPETAVQAAQQALAKLKG